MQPKHNFRSCRTVDAAAFERDCLARGGVNEFREILFFFILFRCWRIDEFLLMRGCVGDSTRANFQRRRVEMIKAELMLSSLRECFVRNDHRIPTGSLCSSLLTCRMNFLYCAFEKRREKSRGKGFGWWQKRKNRSLARCIHVVSFWKERQRGEDQEGARVGKSITYLFARS